MDERWTIGRLAKAAGVNVETVRYYQRRGLIARPARPAGGQRHYAPAVAEQIAFIRRAQHLGFSLDEIGKLMRAREPRSTRALAERKYAELEGRREQLTTMLEELGRLIERSRARRGRGACPIVAALKEKS